MSKKPLEVVAPVSVGDDFVSDSEERKAYQYFKGVIHACIPFAIGIFSPKIAIVYFLCVFVLYSTVFRHKSQGFFVTLAIAIVLFLGFLIPT